MRLKLRSCGYSELMMWRPRKPEFHVFIAIFINLSSSWIINNYRFIAIYRYFGRFLERTAPIWPNFPNFGWLKFFLPLRFGKAGRVRCGGAREPQWATCHNGVTPSKAKECLKSPCFFRSLAYKKYWHIWYLSLQLTFQFYTR